MDLFSKKCSLGHANAPTASFCSICGERLSGGTEVVCGSCGTKNRSDARFCKECGNSMSSSAVPQIKGNHWVRGEQDFAVRVESSDLKGLFMRGVIIEPGTNALLLDGGATQGTLGPGTYHMDDLEKRLKDWIMTGVGSQVAVLLVDVTPTDLDFAAGGVYTTDPLNIGVRVKLQTQVDNPGMFLVNMLKGRERFTRANLEGYLYPEISQVLERWVGQHSVKQLAEDFSLREKLELDLDEALKKSFKLSGLSFLQVRASEINLEHLDRIKGITSKYALQVAEADAELQGRVSIYNILRQNKLQDWAEEEAKVLDEERKVALYDRMRKAVSAGKMDEVRSEAEFEAFLDDMDRQKLLREKEKAELLQTWQEVNQDKQRARAHMLARLDMEQNYELRMVDLRLQSELSEAQLQSEQKLERMKSVRYYEVETEKLDFELKQEAQKAEFQAQQLERKRNAEDAQARRELELRKSLHGQELEEMLSDLKVAAASFNMLLDKRERELAITWEDDNRRALAEFDRQMKLVEVETQRERERMKHELDRLEALGKLGTEALIAASPTEQGKILADLKKNADFKNMTEDQILAMAAKDSPAVAQALAEKFKAMADGKSSERERDMYEKLMAEKDSSARAMREMWDQAAAREKSTTERAFQSNDRALDRMAETAQAFARNQAAPTVVVTGQGGSQVFNPAGGGNLNPSGGSQTKTCPVCGQVQSADALFCPDCGNEFKGMGKK